MPSSRDTIHYVKFIRGTTAAWNNLSKKDDDTLYFVYEDKDATKGLLYLGDKLISGSLDGSTTINLGDLANVNIDGDILAHKQILIYNENSGQWENADLSDILNIGVMQGATEQSNGVSGLVPVPLSTDINKFLSGSGQWKEVPLHTFNTKNFVVNNNNVSLAGYELAPVGSTPIKTNNGISWTIPPVAIQRQEVGSLNELQRALHGYGSFIPNENTMYIVPSENPAASNFYEEYIIVNNNLEKIGGNIDSSNYVTNNIFNTRVGDLENILYDQSDNQGNVIHNGLITEVNDIKIQQAQIGDLNTLITSTNNTSNTLVEEINLLNERMTWSEA